MSGWQPIATAPKDGTHILACIADKPFGWTIDGPLPPVQTVVHWWHVEGEEGFYPSVQQWEGPDDQPLSVTHWKPLDSPQGDAK